MKRPIYSILAIIFLSAVGLSAQSHRSEYQMESMDPSLLEAEVVILNEERKLTFGSKGQVTLQVKRATLLQRENEDLQSVVIRYDPDSKLNSFNLVTFDAAGKKVRTYTKSDLNDQAVSFQSSISDNRIYWLDVVSDNYPFTMEIQYEIQMEGMSKLNALQWNILPGFGASLQKAKLLIEYPESFEVDVLGRNIEVEVEGNTTQRGNFKLVKLGPIDPYQYEEIGATSIDVLPSIWVFPHDIRLDEFSGSLEDWNSYGQLMGQLNTSAGKAPEELQAEIQSRVRNATTDLERIEILYRFMQSEMRYVSIQLGIGGWKPLPVSYVYEQKYGDCKALSIYMKAMLEEVGIASYPVVIYRGDIAASQLDPVYPTFVFNHVLLYVPSEDMFLECTSSSYPAGFIGMDNLSRRALLVTDTGGELIEMPRSEETMNRQAQLVQIGLGSDGSANIHLEEHSFGGLHEFHRFLHSRLQSDEQLEGLIDYLELPAHEMGAWSLMPEADTPEAHLEMDFVIHRFGSKMGRRIFIPMQLSTIVPDLPAACPDRSRSLILRNGYQRAETVVFELPDGYEVETVPDLAQNIESPFGTFSVLVEVKGTEIRVNQTFLRLDGEWPADHYEAYRQFLMEASQLMKDQIVLVQIRP